jgi:hypothetical protein
MATPRTTNETIYQTCLDLHNAGRLISRQVLVKLTGIKMGQVDDHVTRMVDVGRLRRVANGVLEVVEQFPPDRAISKTRLPDGTVILEVGDNVLKLTPSEAQKLGADLMGEATVYAQLRGDRDVQDQVSRLERQAVDTKRRMDALMAELVRLRQQPELAFE